MPTGGSESGGAGGCATRTLAGAERLAAVIRGYWQERGYGDVLTGVISVSRRDDGKAPVAGIRSNLVGGLPPGMAGRWLDPRSARRG